MKDGIDIARAAGAHMQQSYSVSTTRKLPLFIVCLFSLVISGCTHLVRVVGLEYQVPIADGKRVEGTFNKERQTIFYTYKLENDHLLINGTITPSGNLKKLDVRILFVNSEGKKLQEKRLYYSGYRNFNTYWGEPYFDKSYSLPPGTTAFSFDIYQEHYTSRN